MDLAKFEYDLPPDRIAQQPTEPRDAARLLVIDRARLRWDDRSFRDLPTLLRPGDCLVLNETRVVPARLRGQRLEDGAQVEMLVVRVLAGDRWEALVRPARRCRPGARVSLAGGAAVATVVAAGDHGVRELTIEAPWTVAELLDRHGQVPLPTYLARAAAPTPEDAERYQTVYARADGSVAAPTAGLHFTPALLERVRSAGVEVHALTLHVGPATFRPIRAANVCEHRMPAERVDIPRETATAVERARAEGRRVVAVGTTTTRTLEWAADGDGHVRHGPGEADLFILPGHTFRAVDALVTNFHLPRSTLLVLVSAFAGRELILDAYRHAVATGYRFYSYGDATLIV